MNIGRGETIPFVKLLLSFPTCTSVSLSPGLTTFIDILHFIHKAHSWDSSGLRDLKTAEEPQSNQMHLQFLALLLAEQKGG